MTELLLPEMFSCRSRSINIFVLTASSYQRVVNAEGEYVCYSCSLPIVVGDLVVSKGGSHIYFCKRKHYCLDCALKNGFVEKR